MLLGRGVEGCWDGIGLFVNAMMMVMRWQTRRALDMPLTLIPTQLEVDRRRGLHGSTHKTYTPLRGIPRARNNLADFNWNVVGGCQVSIDRGRRPLWPDMAVS